MPKYGKLPPAVLAMYTEVLQLIGYSTSTSSAQLREYRREFLNSNPNAFALPGSVLPEEIQIDGVLYRRMTDAFLRAMVSAERRHGFNVLTGRKETEVSSRHLPLHPVETREQFNALVPDAILRADITLCSRMPRATAIHRPPLFGRSRTYARFRRAYRGQWSTVFTDSFFEELGCCFDSIATTAIFIVVCFGHDWPFYVRYRIPNSAILFAILFTVASDLQWRARSIECACSLRSAPPEADSSESSDDDDGAAVENDGAREDEHQPEAEEDDDATEREPRDDEDENPNRSQQQAHHLRCHRTNAVPVRRRTPGRRTAMMVIGRT
jgi:hypothetical protein